MQKLKKGVWVIRKVFGLAVLTLCVLSYFLCLNPVITFPPPKMPRPNAYNYDTQAIALYRKLQASSAAKTPPSSKTVALNAYGPPVDTKYDHYPVGVQLDWMRKYSAVLKIVRNGFHFRYREPLGSSENPGYEYKFQSLANLFIIESQSRSKIGDWNGAAQSAVDCLRFGHDLPRGGALAAAINGNSVDDKAETELQVILPHLDSRRCFLVARRIQLLEKSRYPLAGIYETKKELDSAQFVKFAHDAGGTWIVLTAFTNFYPRNWNIAKTIWHSSKKQTLKDYGVYMNAVISRSKLPYLVRKKIVLPYYPTKFLWPYPDWYEWRDATDRTDSAITLLQFALRAFHLDRGQYPKSLKELIPAYLATVPADPFGGGEAMRYHKTATGYLLYSIGPDGFDDGGRPIYDPTRRHDRYRIGGDRTGDVVAGVNH